MEIVMTSIPASSVPALALDQPQMHAGGKVPDINDQETRGPL
jgi:hypothetical protein